MASLMQQGERYYCQFLYHGKRHCFALGNVPPSEAATRVSQVDYLLLLKQGYLQIPPGMSIVSFLEMDGKPPREVRPHELSLGSLRDQYTKTREGSLEGTTMNGMRLHFKHLVAKLGENFPIEKISLAELQSHADRRAQKKTSRGKISPATIRKELVSLRTAWNWGANMGLLQGRFPALKLVSLKKPDEKPPFQTWAEIERQLPGSTAAETAVLWNSLYLTLPEIAELLEHCKSAHQPWVYYMFCFAAHTGARRSEMVRCLLADLDMDGGGTVVVREKKRSHDKRTTRRVPLTPFLKTALADWLLVHPGGKFLFCQHGVVRSKTRRSAPTPITRDEAHDHFKRTFSETKWKVLRGWHALRHSFISACASQGTDQRLLQEWCGHMTADMQRRYAHLYPSVQQEAITRVFATAKAPRAGTASIPRG